MNRTVIAGNRKWVALLILTACFAVAAVAAESIESILADIDGRQKAGASQWFEKTKRMCEDKGGDWCALHGYALQILERWAEAKPLSKQAGASGTPFGTFVWAHYLNTSNEMDRFPASDLMKKACDQGNPRACVGWGVKKQFGEGTEKDAAAGNAILEKQCGKGQALGCYHLAYSYQRGFVETDFDRAAELYAKACGAGVMMGCFRQGVMAEDGLGTEKDIDKAYQLYLKACDGGAAAGCYGVGIAYRRGAGVKKSSKLSKKYLKESCDGGWIAACKALE